jgi:hypothetical protein
LVQRLPQGLQLFFFWFAWWLLAHFLSQTTPVNSQKETFRRSFGPATPTGVAAFFYFICMMTPDSHAELGDWLPNSCWVVNTGSRQCPPTLGVNSQKIGSCLNKTPKENTSYIGYSALHQSLSNPTSLYTLAPEAQSIILLFCSMKWICPCHVHALWYCKIHSFH